MLTDKNNVLELAALMRCHGIHDIVLCPGSRNIPLVQTFSALEEMNCYAVTDERSAGFFAMGLALQSGRPAAVCCTSGTALLNLHPAVAEATYQRIPLLVVSADRPAAWIDQMAGQTLVQPGVFGQLGVRSYNIPEFHTEEEHWFGNRQIQEAFNELSRRHPAHLNLPLDEPLFQFTTKALPEVRKIQVHPFQQDPQGLKEKMEDLKKYKKIMLVIGQGSPDPQASPLPENIVCLSEHIGNSRNTLRNFDSILLSIGEDEEKLEALAPDLLITVGGHIVSKRFKQFIRQHAPAAHWLVDEEGRLIDLFCCLDQVFTTSASQFLQTMASYGPTIGDPDYAAAWKEQSAAIPEPDLPYSEISAIGQTLHSLPTGSILHLANSSTVRYAQLFQLEESIEVHCNRGTSGIEGSLSTAIGYASASPELNFILIGDLSFFYDANALWNQHVGKNCRLLLLNNGGGEIFKTLPHLDTQAESGPFILGKHATSARAWAETMGWEYLEAREEEDLEIGVKALTYPGSYPKPVLLEVFTGSDRDAELLNNYYKILKNK